jgi:hypothetical protein
VEVSDANRDTALAPGGLLVSSRHHPCWVPGNFGTWAARGGVEIPQYLDEHVQDVGGVAPREDLETDAHEILTRVPNFIVSGARRTRRA